MKTATKQKILTYCIAAVWLINGLFCKVLNMVPRHRKIVGAILGSQHAATTTFLIGIAETLMSVWIFSNYLKKTNTILQIVIIGIMNIVEFILVPDLLLWGRLNIVCASLLIVVVYYNGFVMNKKKPDIKHV